jgi:hypothetical protein
MNAHQRRVERRAVARFREKYAPLFNRWPHWTERAEKRCRACNGNDGDLPCAYPEGHPNCLRGERAGGKA